MNDAFVPSMIILAVGILYPAVSTLVNVPLKYTIVYSSNLNPLQSK